MPSEYPVLTWRGRNRAITAAVVLLALLAVTVVLLDWREVQHVLSIADWQWIAPALLLTGLSYWCLSHSFALINRWFGITMGWRDLLEVGFVSSAMIASLGGLAGHALRVLLMARRRLAPGEIMAPSLFHSYVESLIFFGLIPASLTYLLFTHPLSSNVATGVGIGTGVLGTAFALTAVVFFFAPARRLALNLVQAFWRWTTRRDNRSSLLDFDITLRRGLATLRTRPRLLGLPVTLILADRVARVGVVWLCFLSLGSDVGLGVVVTGFSIGVALGVMSMVPGGLGVQEGTMAGTYHLLGVPLEQAVLASVLFRMLYYMVPLAVSLVFYRGALWGHGRLGSETDERHTDPPDKLGVLGAEREGA